MNLLQHWRCLLISGIALLSLCSCAGITPDGQMRNDREEGPVHGLFSGPDGEFVLVAPEAAGAKETGQQSAEPAKSQE